jgi:uracil-DNA glycosylase family 4
MKWSERQLAMLREMGVRLWPAPDRDEAVAVHGAPAVATGEAQVVAPVIAQVTAQVVEPVVEPVIAQVVGPAVAQVVEPVVAKVPAQPLAPIAKLAKQPSGPLPFTGVRPAGIDSMSMDELSGAVAGCAACGLCESRTHTVFGVGNVHAHWMIIGEAPGQTEDERGEPFVGKAGQLLDNMLRACGLTRSEGPPEQQVFIVNTLKCRPPGNRNPTPEELAQCEPYLMRQIALVQPRIILAMGRFALQSLLKSTDPVGKLRGRVHRLAGVPLVATYHPAYLLRNPEDKGRAWDDLCLAMEALKG